MEIAEASKAPEISFDEQKIPPVIYRVAFCRFENLIEGRRFDATNILILTTLAMRIVEDVDQTSKICRLTNEQKKAFTMKMILQWATNNEELTQDERTCIKVGLELSIESLCSLNMEKVTKGAVGCLAFCCALAADKRILKNIKF